MDTINLDKINELISSKEFEEAKNQLNEFITADETNIEALKLLGLCNVNLGLYKEGQNNFETVVKYKNDDATSWFYLANCYDSLEDFLHAKPAYQTVIDLRENYVEAYKNLGVIYLKTGEPTKAFELAKKALDIVQDDYLLYYLAGTALLANKNIKQSVVYLEQAMALESNHSQICNNLGTAYLTLGDYDKAYETYLHASNINPKDSMTYYNIASILQIQNKHEQACEYFEKAYSIDNLEHYMVSLALSEFKAGLIQEAIKHYKILATKHPEKHNFKYNLACCYEKIKEYSFAIGILDQLVLLNPKSKIMAQKLAKLYLLTDQPLKAKEIYEKIINIGIVSEEIYYQYALICVKTDNLDTAEKILKKVIELNPKAAYARKDLGIIYLEKRLFDYAKDEFEKAYEIAPEDEDILFEYANYLHATSDFTKAKEFYKKAFEKEPKNPNTIIFSALNDLALNNLEEASKYIEMALKIVPENPFVLFTAGKIYYAQKDYENAQLLLIKAWETDKTPDVENLLGLTYFELNEFEKANNIFLKLLKENPKNTTLMLNSAKCYEKLSIIDKAKEQLNKALEIFPEMEEATALLDKLNPSS